MQTALGALLGLLVAILLIIRKVHPVYGLMTGAVLGSLLGGLSLNDTMTVMIDGVKDVSPAVIRILSAGVLSGILIETGAAAKISSVIISKLGKKQIFLALTIATFMLCAVGVFVDVAVITVAPLALSMHKHLRIPVSPMLVAMIGGGKSGNIISPNPNTIISAANFGTDLSSVMFAGIIPAIVGIFVTVLIAQWMFGKEMSDDISYCFIDEKTDEYHPSLWASLSAPLTTIGLLSFRPLFGFIVDPLLALPLGGIVGIICIGCYRQAPQFLASGLAKMTPVAVLLIGTGTLAGVIKNSALKDLILQFLTFLDLEGVIIAPLSGVFMSAATASTTAGAMLASASFSDVLLSMGIPAVWGAVMVNAGSTVLDHLPHGSFFHTTGGVCSLQFKERLRLIPYETAIGLALSLLSVCCFQVFS